MKLNSLFMKMTEYFSGDAKRIQHFIKVHSFAKLIGEAEAIDSDEQFVLEISTIVHDIGIKSAEEKYGSSDGKLQEKEGPAEAEKMLVNLGFDNLQIDRVKYLVGHHHTYDNITGMDYQILVESDFLVNLYESGASIESIKSAYKNIFKTETGKKLCRLMFKI